MERASTRVKVQPKKGEIGDDGRPVTAGTLKRAAAATAELMERRSAGTVSAREAVRAVRAVIPRTRGGVKQSGIAPRGTAAGLGVTWWSVRAFAEKYAREHGAHLKRAAEMRRRIERFIELLGAWADVALDDLTQAAVQDAATAALEIVSASTVDRMLADVSAMYNRAIAERVAESNPTHGVRLPAAKRAEVQRRDAFTGEELRLLLTCQEGEWSDFILATLLLGGQRLGDMALLRWNQWDKERGHILMTTAKTNRSMVKPVLPMLRELLERRAARAIAGIEYVFPWQAARYGQSGDSSKLSLDFRALLERLNILDKKEEDLRRAETRARGGKYHTISRVSFHSLRETAVTFLAGIGVPWELVLMIVGISSAEIARRHYLQPTPAQLAQAMQPMEKFLRGLNSTNKE